MAEYNYDDPIAITENIYWIGYYDQATQKQCNSYLLIDHDEAVLIDPGSIPEFPVIMRKIIDLINPGKISLVVLTDCDPDVCANLPIVEDLIGREDLLIAGHHNTLKQVRHLGIQSGLYPVNEHENRYTLKSGRQLSFYPNLYLHSPGSITIYDAASQSLFSGDLFGGDEGDWSLFDHVNFPRNLDEFHQTFMPSNQVLRFGLRTIETLDIHRILPQHGSVIEGGNVVRAFAHLKILDCGIDFIGS